MDAWRRTIMPVDAVGWVRPGLNGLKAVRLTMATERLATHLAPRTITVIVRKHKHIEGAVRFTLPFVPPRYSHADSIAHEIRPLPLALQSHHQSLVGGVADSLLTSFGVEGLARV
jgi:hypothetical protein